MFGSFGSDINCYSEGGGPPSLRILCEPDKTVTAVVFHGKCFYPHLYGRCRSVPRQDPFPSLRNVHTLPRTTFRMRTSSCSTSSLPRTLVTLHSWSMRCSKRQGYSLEFPHKWHVSPSPFRFYKFAPTLCAQLGVNFPALNRKHTADFHSINKAHLRPGRRGDTCPQGYPQNIPIFYHSLNLSYYTLPWPP